MGIDYLIPGHCSGDRFYDLARDAMGDKVIHSAVGARFVFNSEPVWAAPHCPTTCSSSYLNPAAASCTRFVCAALIAMSSMFAIFGRSRTSAR